jgi:hypothetical protein
MGHIGKVAEALHKMHCPLSFGSIRRMCLGFYKAKLRPHRLWAQTSIFDPEQYSFLFAGLYHSPDGRRYIVDDQGQPMLEPDEQKFVKWIMKEENRILRRDIISDELWVCTVFLGIDHNTPVDCS